MNDVYYYPDIKPPKKRKFPKWLIIIFIVVAIVGFFSIIGESQDEYSESQVSNTEPSETEPTTSVDDYKAECKSYDYKKVLRNPDDYIGKKIKLTVKISTVSTESAFRPKYYFAYTNDEYDMWWEDRYAIFDMRENKEPKLLEDDIIIVYGEISSPRETQSLIVNSEEVFCVDMKYVELIAE